MASTRTSKLAEARSASTEVVQGNAKGRYLETVQLMERLHRQFLELIQSQLNEHSVEDINSVQALILHSIGRNEILVGELTQRGYYLGTNVSYNVRKLVESGYLLQERSQHDRRAWKLRLADKGLRLCEQLDRVFEDHTQRLEEVALIDDLAQASSVLKNLSGFWTTLAKLD